MARRSICFFKGSSVNESIVGVEVGVGVSVTVGDGGSVDVRPASGEDRDVISMGVDNVSAPTEDF